jgi:hypothetical protein
MGKDSRDSEVDEMNFDKFPNDDFVGFYAALDADGTYIKTLGALVDTCATSSAASTIL